VLPCTLLWLSGKGISLLRLVGRLGLKFGGNTTRDSRVSAH